MNISKPRSRTRNTYLPFAAIRSFSAAVYLRKPCHGWTNESGKWFTCPFSSVFHSTKLADSTGAAAAQRATISEKPYGSSKRKWREWHMRNNRLLPYETIVQAASGEPEAVGTVLQYYRRRIQCAARVNGRVDQDTEDYITQTLLTAIFKFRFGR